MSAIGFRSFMTVKPPPGRAAGGGIVALAQRQLFTSSSSLTKASTMVSSLARLSGTGVGRRTATCLCRSPAFGLRSNPVTSSGRSSLVSRWQVRRLATSQRSKAQNKAVEVEQGSARQVGQQVNKTTVESADMPKNTLKGVLHRFLAPKEMPARHTAAWYREMVLICTVFAITGSSTMVVVRPAVRDVLGLEGSFKDGPWSYRICSIVIMSPVYASLLVVVGTVFGRHAYFRHFAVKIFSRFGIPPELLDKSFHETKKHFRKW